MTGQWVHLQVEEFLQEKALCFLVRLAAPSGKEIWLRKSHMPDHREYQIGDRDKSVRVSCWLAKAKGLFH